MVSLLDVVVNRVSSYPKTDMGRNVSFFFKSFFLDAEVGRRRIIGVVTTWILKNISLMKRSLGQGVVTWFHFYKVQKKKTMSEKYPTAWDQGQTVTS